MCWWKFRKEWKHHQPWTIMMKSGALLRNHFKSRHALAGNWPMLTADLALKNVELTSRRAALHTQSKTFLYSPCEPKLSDSKMVRVRFDFYQIHAVRRESFHLVSPRLASPCLVSDWVIYCTISRSVNLLAPDHGTLPAHNKNCSKYFYYHFRSNLHMRPCHDILFIDAD